MLVYEKGIEQENLDKSPCSKVPGQNQTWATWWGVSVLTTALSLPISLHSNDPGQDPNADYSIKCTSHHHSVCFTNQFQDQHVTRNLKSENKWKKGDMCLPMGPFCAAFALACSSAFFSSFNFCFCANSSWEDQGNIC